MPEAWTDKDERQYEEIKKQQKAQGKSTDRAEEIAARTVNKRRREEGRAEDSSGGTGNPNTRLEDRTKEQIYNRARELGIEGRSNMSKEELIKAVRSRS